MSNNTAKVQKPHLHFDDPHDVVADPSLNQEQKQQALDNLEQDARQLAVASDEGMSGGEPTALHEVLEAKETLDLPPMDQAYEMVRRDLVKRHAGEENAERSRLIGEAISALEALAGGEALGGGNAEEAETEERLEKLDP